MRVSVCLVGGVVFTCPGHMLHQRPPQNPSYFESVKIWLGSEESHVTRLIIVDTIIICSGKTDFILYCKHAQDYFQYNKLITWFLCIDDTAVLKCPHQALSDRRHSATR